jgi:hypothetical protein
MMEETIIVPHVHVHIPKIENVQNDSHIRKILLSSLFFPHLIL